MLMANSASVFSQTDDFESGDPKLPHCHYYPSSTVSLSDDAKKTALHSKIKDGAKNFEEHLNANIQATSNSENIDTSGSTKYNESWHDSTANTTIAHFEEDQATVDMKKPGLDQFIDDSPLTNTAENDKPGTLARFIQRFREQPAQPRKKRLQNDGKNNEFWWLTSLSSNSPVSTEEFSVVTTPSRSISTSSERIKASKDAFKEPTREATDSETNRIQFRASKLLELSENTLNSSYSSRYSNSPQSVPPQKTKPMSQLKETNDESTPLGYMTTRVIPSSPRCQRLTGKLYEKPARPEDDILYQWRLSRKMELAKAANDTNPFLKNYKEPTTKETVPKNEKKLDISTTNSSKQLDISTTNSSISMNSRKEILPANECSCGKLVTNPIEVQREKFIDQNGNKASVGSFIKSSAGCIPSHLHSICDILPCMHGLKLQSPTQCQSDKEVQIQSKTLCNKSTETSDIMNVNFESHISNHVTHSTSTLQRDAKSSLTNNRAKPRDQISPAINQIISEHLFLQTDVTPSPPQREQADTLWENDKRLTPTPAQNERKSVHPSKEAKHLPVTQVNIDSSTTRKKDSLLPSTEDATTANVLSDSSSEEEFAADEILRELRTRRSANKKRLKLVMDALSEFVR